MKAAPFKINDTSVAPGSRACVELPVARLYTDTPVNLRVEVIHGRRPGPVLLVCAAIHGDELNGVEICRRLTHQAALARLHGTLLIVPVVNVFGFIEKSRYLPDRRDLNRCFPGSSKGSLGSRLAYLFRKQLLKRATHAIDLHTGAIHRTNLPQIRAELDNPTALEMARAFGAPVILDATVRDGSLRASASEDGIPLILYEAGEGLRLDETAIRAGLRGILAVMRRLEMLPARKRHSGRHIAPVLARRSYWVRSEQDGLLLSKVKLGERVSEGQVLAYLAHPFQQHATPLLAREAGIIIGAAQIPLVNEGEALYHIAEFERLHRAAHAVESFHEHYETAPEEIVIPLPGMPDPEGGEPTP